MIYTEERKQVALKALDLVDAPDKKRAIVDLLLPDLSENSKIWFLTFHNRIHDGLEWVEKRKEAEIFLSN